MRELVTFTTAVVFVGVADLACAADLGDTRDVRDWRDPTPVAVHLTNWTGFYIGAGVGGAMFSTQVDGSSGDTRGGPSAIGSDDLGSQSFFGSVHTGFDVQFPISRWVAGAFFDYDWLSANADRTISISGVADPAIALPEIKTKLDNEWSVGGRVGYLYTPDMLVYGLAAYTSRSGTLSGSVGTPDSPNHYAYSSFSESLDSGGWSLGAGVETRLRDNWSLKLEYRYPQFEGESGLNPAIGTVCGQGDCYRSLSESMDAQTVRLLLTYKFNH